MLLPLEAIQTEGYCCGVSPQTFAQAIWCEIKDRDYDLKLADWQKRLALRRAARQLESDPQLSARIYRVSDLTVATHCAAGAECHGQRDFTADLLDVTKDLTAFYGSPGPRGETRWLSGLLLISSPAETHARVQSVLNAMRYAAANTSSGSRVLGPKKTPSATTVTTTVYCIAGVFPDFACESEAEYAKHTTFREGPYCCRDALRNYRPYLEETVSALIATSWFDEPAGIGPVLSIERFHHVQNFCFVTATPDAHPDIGRALEDLRTLTQRSREASRREAHPTPLITPGTGARVRGLNPAALAEPETYDQARHEGVLTKLRRFYHHAHRTPLDPSILANNPEPRPAAHPIQPPARKAGPEPPPPGAPAKRAMRVATGKVPSGPPPVDQPLPIPRPLKGAMTDPQENWPFRRHKPY